VTSSCIIDYAAPLAVITALNETSPVCVTERKQEA